MKPRSAPRTRVNIPVFPETETSWMMSGTGSSWIEPWNDMMAWMLASLRRRVDVADRERQGVSGVERHPRALASQQRQHHRADLRLLGLPVADESLLHESRLVLEDGKAVARGGEHQGSASVRELDGRRRVLPGEDRLDRNGVGAALLENQGRALEQEPELVGEGERGGRPPDAAAVQRQPATIEDDDAPAGRHRPRVETENLQVAASVSSPPRSRSSPRLVARLRGPREPP